MFLAGTLLNVATVLLGTTVGLLAGGRMSQRLQSTLTDGLGLFTVALGLSQILQFMLDSEVPVTHSLAILGGLLVGGLVGELLRLQEALDAAGDWFQRRLSRGDAPSRVSEAFVTTSLVFCVGPLTILGSIQNGATGDIELLAVKSLLDGIASVAFAAALGRGVYLAALTVFLVQGGISTLAYVFGGAVDPALVAAATAVGGLLVMGVGLRLLEIKQIRLAAFLPALLVAPLFVILADAITAWLP